MRSQDWQNFTIKNQKVRYIYIIIYYLEMLHVLQQSYQINGSFAGFMVSSLLI